MLTKFILLLSSKKIHHTSQIPSLFEILNVITLHDLETNDFLLKIS